MNTQISKIGAFQGTKITLSKLTIRKYIDAQGNLQYCIFRGKGTGTMFTMSNDWDAILFLNDNFDKVQVKTIYSLVDNRMGAAIFINDKMWNANNHPFSKQGYKF